MASEFRVDVLNAAGTRIGDGPLDTVQSLDDVARLDNIGSLSFTLPVADPRTQYISAGTSFDVYDRVDGYLGRYYYKNKQQEADAQGGKVQRVAAHDSLIELARVSVNFRRTYNNVAVDYVIGDLVDDVTGWIANVDLNIGNTTVTFEGESVLAAVDAMRDRWNQHFRLGNGRRILDFGAFGLDSGLVLANLRGQVQSELGQNTDIALIDSIQLVEEADEIFNRVIPLGAGQGTAQLTIQTATLGTYTVQTGTNADGSNFYYIEDSDSVTSYGRRAKVAVFPNIRPVTNSDANILNAANALKLTAEAYIARHIAPRAVYAVSVHGLRRSVSVGDLVRLQYRGVVEGYAYIDVNQTFYVMDLQRKRNVSGERSAVITIASIAERRTDDTDVVLELFHDIKVLKVHVPITLANSPVGPYTLRMDSTHNAEFTVRIGNEVTFLNYAKLRFRTSPLKSSVTTVSTVNSSVQSSTSATHTHSITADGSHTHTLSITSTGIGSSGASSQSTTLNGGTHIHEIDIRSNSGLSGYGVALTSGGVLFWENSANPGNPSTEVTADHAHGIDHNHNIDHGHSGSTAGSTTHDHTIGASGSHTHNVTIPSHNHTLSYGIYQDTLYPTSISVAIDGVDRTGALGGPWDAGGAGTEQEVDITTYLVNAVGGLRQNHRIAFSCSSGQGEIEAECAVLTSIQAIVVS